MGGAVSSGRDNNELIDNLMGGNYIRSRSVEQVFRALDRAEYMTPESRDQAYKDLAWRNGALHMSSPCIYSEVMEGLELRPGLSFLNIGSGTGYLSTLAGLILGSGGISHGIEVHASVVEYANKKLGQFLSNSPTLDEFDFCEPKFFVGNGLCLPPQQLPYDRVYCGAGCPDEYENYFKHLIKVGGILVMPLRDSLLQVRRVQEDQWLTRNLLTVSFAPLRVPPKEDALNYVKLEEQRPARLQALARGQVRAAVRRGVVRRAPELLHAPPRRAPPAACPRRICIPIEPGGAVEGLNILHDLDADTGANEMNALLSLVIRMDQNRVAGAIRFDRIESSHSDSNSNSRSRSRDSSDDDGPSTDQGNERRRRRSRPARQAARDSTSGSGSDSSSLFVKTDDERSNLSDTKSNRRDSGGSSTNTTSKDTRKSTRDRSKLTRKSDDRNGRKSRDSSEIRITREPNESETDHFEVDSKRKDQTSSEESRSSKDRRRKSDRKGSGDKSPRDRSGRRDRAGSSRRSGSSGSLLAFEFQATDRSQPATSAGATRSTDNSAPTSGNDSGNKNKKKNKKSSRRPPCQACNPGDGDDVMPAEVELCFRGRKLDILPSRAEQSGSYWDDIKTDTDEGESSPEGESEKKEAPEGTVKNKAKRQKLDSGIGENTPSSSSPDKSKAGETETDERPSDSVTDEAEPAHETGGRRRVHKRSRGAATATSAGGGAGDAGASSTSSSAEEGRGGGGGGARGGAPSGPARRRAARRSRGYDARRVRLSFLMKKAVRELPLPYPLQKYVNLGRCFEF